jgi:outer membrane autotransporter protein
LVEGYHPGEAGTARRGEVVRLGLFTIGFAIVLLWSAVPAEAACVVSGAGTQTSLQSGDSITCTGAGNSTVTTDNGANGVGINIGDGTPTSLDDAFGVGLDTTSSSTVFVHDQATITATNHGIDVTGGGFNVVTVLSGGSIGVTNTGGVGIVLDNTDGNTVVINGTVDSSLTAGAIGIAVTPGSTGNAITIGATGIVQANDQWAILIEGGPGSTNTVTNFGLITTGSGTSISGSPGSEIIINAGIIEKTIGLGDGADIVVNSGTIANLNLQEGDDALHLEAGSTTGTVFGGTGTDTLGLGGGTDANFVLASIGAAAQYREFEVLQKNGTSTWTLLTSTIATMMFNIEQGTAIVDGSMANFTTMVNGGTLGGSGTVGDVTVNSGGTVAPGNSIGTLNVNGNATFNAGSTYEVEVNSGGQSDLLLATGVVTINGGTVAVVPFPDYALGNPYTIITAAGGVTGVFDSSTFSLLFVTPTLTYDANNVYVTLTQTADLADWAATPNQLAAAGGLDAVGAGNAAFDAAILLGSGAAAQSAFDALSGEGHASLKGVLVENSALVRDAVLGRLRGAFAAPDTVGAALGYAGDAMLAPESAQGGGLWGQLHGGLGEIAADGNAARTGYASGGLLLGADGDLGDWRLGLFANAGMTGLSIPDRATSGNGTDYGAGVYAGTQWGDTGFAFGAAYTRHAISTTREVVFPGFTDTLTASYGAATGQVFGELNHEFDLGSISFTPFAQLAYVNHATDAFTEQGGAAALSSAASVVDGTFATLGLRASKQFVVGGDGLGTLRGGLAWRHAYADLPSAINSFSGGTGFTVSGAPIAADALVLEAGLDLDLANGMDLALTYDGRIATTGQSHALKAAIGGQF